MDYACPIVMNLAPKKFVLLAVCAAFAMAAGCTSVPTAPGTSPANISATPTYTIPLQVGMQQLLVQIADTDFARGQGLSGRERLADNLGMLFDFRNTSQTHPGFWMKEMKFNLDIIWINKGKIIGITPEVPAPKAAADSLPNYYPPSPVDMVLEVNAGWSAAHNIKVGDEVILQ
jgi:uncharacterized protein